ncbi:MAG: ATP-binding protein [Methanoregula sp.]|nr:ATP-binding protein [Methanoregula sp.]
MIFQDSLFFIPLLVSAAITAALAVISFRRRSDPIILLFIILMAASTIWTLGYAGQIASADLPTNLLFNTLEYPGLVTIPVIWLLIVLSYMGYNQIITTRNIAALMVVPAIVVFLVATNQYHYLFYSAFVPEAFGGAVVWNFIHGPLFWLHVGYSYLLLILAFLLIASRLFYSPGIYRQQILIMLFAACIPFLANIIYVFQFNPLPGLDITPFTFMLTGIIVALGLFRFQLFSMAPVTYPLIFSAITNGVVVLDRNNRISEINPAAMKILAPGDTSVIGQPAEKVLSSEFMSFLGPEVSRDGTILQTVITKQNGSTKELEVTCMPIVEPPSGYYGRIIVLRDITEVVHARNALETINRKLNLLSSITRHDMQNKLTGLRTYIELAKDETDEAGMRSYLPQIEKIAEVLQEELEFTRDYQDLGVTRPVWQDIGEMIQRKSGIMTTLNIRVENSILPASLEVYADPLLEKVFTNLIDNALRYGGKTLTTLRTTTRQENRSLVITFSDDGAGIAAEDKPLLFTKGFGKHTGLGLFLSREILSITGISIAENGEPGTGARFEITVPEGTWRAGNP